MNANEKATKTKSDLIGRTFGAFVVLEEAPPKIRANGKKVRMWKCQCSCGNVRYLNKREIDTEKRKSCGCKWGEYQRMSRIQHGDSHMRLHNTWSGIRARCYCKTDYHYQWYGARGIRMNDAWKDDYAAFKEWALDNGYSPELSLDRIDNNGNYTPDNCRWTTQKAQSNNTRRNRMITAFGETLTLAQWAEKSGIPYHTLKRRIYLGWTPEDALTRDIRQR